MKFRDFLTATAPSLKLNTWQMELIGDIDRERAFDVPPEMILGFNTIAHHYNKYREAMHKMKGWPFLVMEKICDWPEGFNAQGCSIKTCEDKTYLLQVDMPVHVFNELTNSYEEIKFYE